MADKTEKKDTPSFEEALTRLEALVTEMEGGQISLDESMKKFAEGMKLADLCGRKLNETEKKIEILLKKGENGTPAWSEFEAPVAAEKE